MDRSIFCPHCYGWELHPANIDCVFLELKMYCKVLPPSKNSQPILFSTLVGIFLTEKVVVTKFILLFVPSINSDSIFINYSLCLNKKSISEDKSIYVHIHF